MTYERECMRRVIGVTCLLVSALAAGSAPAQDAPAKPWSDAAELGLIVTSGNAEGTNAALVINF